MSILRFLNQTLCPFLQIKDRKQFEHNFHSVEGCMPQGFGLGGAGWVKNFSVGICDGAPSTAHSSWFCSKVHIMDSLAHQFFLRAHQNFKWPIKIVKFACI